MNTNTSNSSKRLLRGLVSGGMALVMAGGLALPFSAWAANGGNCASTATRAENRQEMRAMHEKMLTQAKVEDAQLEKLIAELNRAPEAKKVDLEAQILTKLVAQHHQMLADWESMHAHTAQFGSQHLTQGQKNQTAQR